MQTWKWASLAVMSALCASSAFASGDRHVIWDEEVGLPRCYEHGVTSEVFMWDDTSSYHRDLYLCRIPDPSNWGCFFWERWVQEDRHTLDCETLNTDRLDTYGFPPDAVTALRQVARGANTLELRSPSDVLRDEAIATWDVPTNRKFVSRYGMGFTSEMFKAWVESFPKNASFKSHLTDRIVQESRGQGPDLAARYRDKVIIYCPGLGHVQGAPSPIADYLSGEGVEVQIANTLSRGTLAENRAIIMDLIVKNMKRGKTLMIASESKGSTETLGALLALQGSADYRAGLAAGGKIAGVISFSANFRGSYLADLFENSLLKPIAELVAGILRVFKVDVSEVLVGVHNCASRVVEAYYRESTRLGGLSSMHFPDEWTFVEYSGILPGNGVSTHKQVRMVQDLVSEWFQHSVGANDGLLEYPSTLMKPDWANHQYAAIAYGSHFMVDGNYEGMFSFADPVQVRFILRGLLNATLDQVESRE